MIVIVIGVAIYLVLVALAQMVEDHDNKHGNDMFDR